MESKILKDLIEKSGLNQKQFAKKHGVYEKNLSDWLSGKITPREATLALIAFDEGYEIEYKFELKKL